MKKNILFSILFVGIGFLIYMSVFKNNSNIIDTDHYQQTIDSLNQSIMVHDKEIDSLNASISKRDAKITGYNTELANLKNKLNNEKKSHEADINRINAMSNTDITSEFTNAFKD
jgi:peptidoglycan hydrolase CwlO-like protein